MCHKAAIYIYVCEWHPGGHHIGVPVSTDQRHLQHADPWQAIRELLPHGEIISAAEDGHEQGWKTSAGGSLHQLFPSDISPGADIA